MTFLMTDEGRRADRKWKRAPGTRPGIHLGWYAEGVTTYRLVIP